MKECDHAHIVKCYEACQTPGQVFLFLELMSGGELFDKIVEMGSFTESMAADVSYQCLDALNYMHSKGFVHRDLKPENMLLARKGDLSAVKLTDFGLSAMIDQQSELMRTACGTPAYVAPEVLTLKGGGYDKQVDVWSMGVIIYILLCGFPPFYAQNDNALYAKIKAGRYKFISPHWDPISEAAKSFIRKMLVVDPRQRATIDELLNDPWLSAAKSGRAAEAANGEVDLKQGTEYKIKETEEKLARQTKALKYAITAATAKIRIANAIKLRATRKVGSGGASPPVEPAQPQAAPTPPAAQPAAKTKVGKGKKAVDTGDVDVAIEGGGGGCNCTIL